MDNKDGRRSRVPAGTFGHTGSQPAPEQSAPSRPLDERPRVKTLTGEESPAALAPVPADPSASDTTAPALRGASGDTAPALRGASGDTAPALRGGGSGDTAPALRGGASGDTAPALRGGASTEPVPDADLPLPADRKRYVSTLVGVAPNAARSGAASKAPVLAPPPWRGAGAYMVGDEPQLRISSIPAPKHVPAAPSAAAEPSRSRVTTKMAAVPPVPAHAPAPGADRGSPALGDTIQEMLDAQASVPMQVDEPPAELRSSSEETPIDELPIDEILDKLSEPPPPMIEDAEQERRRLDEPTLVHAAPPPADGPRLTPDPSLTDPLELEAVADPEPEPALPEVDVELEAAAGGASMVKAELKLEPEVKPATKPAAPAAQARPAPPPPPPPPRERPRRAAAAVQTSPAQATSLAPAEVARVSRRPRYRDDAQAGLGIVLVAAMGVIGVGGWFLTRGGYPGMHQQPGAQAASVAAPVPPPATVTAPVEAKPVPAPSEAPAPVAAPASAAEHNAAEDNSAATHNANAKKPPPHAAAQHPGAKLGDEAPPAAVEAAPAEVLKVTPHQDAPSQLGDIPSRDDVLAALAPIRAAVAECARGQRGVAQLDITVANTGFVTHAVVGGDFAGTPEGSCIARVARGAQFVPFKKPRFRVIYPFSL